MRYFALNSVENNIRFGFSENKNFVLLLAHFLTY